MTSRTEFTESIERINRRVRKIADINGMVSGLEVLRIIDEEFGTDYSLRRPDCLGWFDNVGERKPYEWLDVFDAKSDLDFKLPNSEES